MLTTTSIALAGKFFFVIAKKKNGNLYYLTTLGAFEPNIEKARKLREEEMAKRLRDKYEESFVGRVIPVFELTKV